MDAALLYQPESLGRAIEDFVNERAKGDSHERGIGNWYRILELEANELSRFEKSLSGHQQKSLQALGEWWEEKYSISQKGQRIPELFVFGRSCVTTEMYGFDPQKASHFLDRDVEAALYHDALQRLFDLEFIAEMGWKIETTTEGFEVVETKENYLNSLYSVRSKALKYASAQRLVWHFIRDLSTPESDGQSVFNYDIPAWLDCSPWLSPEEKIGLPFYLWDIKNERTVETSRLKAPPRYMCISHTWGRWRKKSEIRLKGVEWLVPENTRFDVAKLPQMLKEADFGLDYVWLDLLCIPQDGSIIAKREVARQTVIFAGSIPCAIWFGPDVPDWRSVTMSLAWLGFNYLQVTSWNAGIRIDKNTLAAKHCSLPKALKDEGFMDSLRSCASRPSGFYHLEKGEDLKEAPHLPSWFSSLWTLQEICLRSSMFLLDEKMRPLRARDNKPIMLDALIAFLEIADSGSRHGVHLTAFLEDYQIIQRWDFEKYRQAQDLSFRMYMDEGSPEKRSQRLRAYPYGAAELLKMVKETSKMYDVAREPVSILWLADYRACKRSRAIAIMSVLGSTKWYEKYLEESSDADRYSEDVDSLVLGKYPVAFLREVADRFGPSFYSFGLLGGFNGSLLSRFEPGMSPIGSMLPFSKNVFDGSREFYPAPLEDMVGNAQGAPNPSITTWVIQQDATVHMGSAAILATQQDLAEHRQFNTWYNLYVWSMVFEEPHKPRRVLKFPALLDMLPTGLKCVFVVLTEGSHYSSGILLHQISEATMVKVGVWFTANTRLWTGSTPPKVVNWTIL